LALGDATEDGAGSQGTRARGDGDDIAADGFVSLTQEKFARAGWHGNHY
jgi:hypothetical protein